MKISINFITGCLMLAVFSQVSAQQLPVMNHYLYNPYLYNPARTGQENLTKINFHFKKQWVNMPESPLQEFWVLMLESLNLIWGLVLCFM